MANLIDCHTHLQTVNLIEEYFKKRKGYAIAIKALDSLIGNGDLEIFNLALKQAESKPDECVMVGDRLDNDIIPANKIGMKTVWIKQGMGGLGNVDLLNFKPDFVINKIEQMLELQF